MTDDDPKVRAPADAAPAADAQGRDPAAPTVAPDGGVVPHLEEPPEVEAMLTVVRPWQLLLILVVASVWLPALMAGIGKAFARADHAVVAARWAAEDAAVIAANPPGDCDSYAILRRGLDPSSSAESKALGALDNVGYLHVKYEKSRGEWIPVDDGESPENLARYWSGLPGTSPPRYEPGRGYTYGSFYQHFERRRFASRVAATFEPGSICYERFLLHANLVSVLQEAMDCDTWPTVVAPSGEAVEAVEWQRYHEVLYYLLNRAACLRDWASFQQTCDLTFALASHQPAYLQKTPCRALGVILEQHGAAMPVAILRDLRARLLALQQMQPDVDRVVAAWKRQFLQNYYGVMLGAYPLDLLIARGGSCDEPIFLQHYAMLYTFRRGRVDAFGARLHAEITANLAAPGTQGSRFVIDGRSADYLGSPTVYEVGAIGAWAFGQSIMVERGECYRQTELRLQLAMLDALLIRAETGAWPASIDALAEPALRVDPFSPSAAALGFRLEASGALRFWSVGFRAVDGGGLFDGEPGFFDYDTIQRLEPPVAEASAPVEVLP